MFIVQLIEATYNFLWGDLFQIPLPVGGSIGISLLIIFLVPAAVYFTIRTRFMQVRLFPDMVRALTEQKSGENGLSPFQTLIVSTATRVGMGNLVGVVAAISAGGAAPFSGCGSWRFWVLPQLLSRPHWHSFIKRKTRSTEVIAVDRLIIFIVFSSAKKAGRKGMFCRRYYLPFRV